VHWLLRCSPESNGGAVLTAVQYCAFPGDVSMAPCDVNDASQRWTFKTPPARESLINLMAGTNTCCTTQPVMLTTSVWDRKN
jgi:hypothetical protein